MQDKQAGRKGARPDSPSAALVRPVEQSIDPTDRHDGSRRVVEHGCRLRFEVRERKNGKKLVPAEYTSYSTKCDDMVDGLVADVKGLRLHLVPAKKMP